MPIKHLTMPRIPSSRTGQKLRYISEELLVRRLNRLSDLGARSCLAVDGVVELEETVRDERHFGRSFSIHPLSFEHFPCIRL